MTRKLILTPYEQGGLDALNTVFNDSPIADKNAPVDVPHILLSALTMAGVDKILSMSEISGTNTTLIKKVVSKSSSSKWSNCRKKVDDAIKLYRTETENETTKEELNRLSTRLSQLLFAIQTNSVLLSMFGFEKPKNGNALPLELQAPTEILFSSVQTKSAQLPVLRYDVEKDVVKRFIGVLESKEFKHYKEAQTEVEQSKSLTNKTISQIEKAGKELYNKNLSLIYLKDNVIKAIPMTSKIIELFFGKLPGILSDYAGNVLSDYLKLNKTIPVYSCEHILSELLKSRLKLENNSR